MIPLGDVQSAVFGAVSRLAPVEVDRRDALGLVLAEQVTAPEAVPPFANTAMDGYAVRAADTLGAAEGTPVRLRVVGELAAGHAPTVPVSPGEAIRIMTGAPMPEGADAIVMVERTQRDPGTDGSDDGVLVTLEVEPGQHVRRAGGDLEAGDVVFEPGAVLTAARIGVLATVGATRTRAFPARASGCSRPATSWSRAARCRRERSGIPTARCCWRSSPMPGRSRSISARLTTTRRS